MLEHGLVAYRWRLDGRPAGDEFPLFAKLRQRGASEFAMRLVLFGEGRTALTGAALAVATDRPGGFADVDLAAVEEVAPALALASYRIGLGRVASGAVSAYLGAGTGRRVLEGAIRRGEGETIAAAIVLADLSGFTALTDREDPRRIVGWLNEHLEAMGDPVLERGGEILKFIGDGLLGVFPVEGGDAAGACASALAAATDALRRNNALNARRAAAGAPTLALDVALHFGEVVYGNIGTARRLDFTVIGRAVNEASRLEVLCRTVGRSLLMSESFARELGIDAAGRVVSLGRHGVRDVGEREIFALAGDESEWG
jgi:adenylate cyclase